MPEKLQFTLAQLLFQDMRFAALLQLPTPVPSTCKLWALLLARLAWAYGTLNALPALMSTSHLVTYSLATGEGACTASACLLPMPLGKLLRILPVLGCCLCH